ncbi:unnamed protein product [Owenia fusiformis]|uniref:Uncharacterized protein n=1 Tax=Owenia fusiformis TaxID=6347 RepID=A0A8J1Y257_OWEFU|nr:unnamed protein product [Owenia fusiformis]
MFRDLASSNMNGVVLVCALAGLLAVTHAADTLRFAAMGDWGTGGSTQKKVAKSMGDWMAKYKGEFIVTLGDNFYNDGANSVKDPQFDKKWKDVYTARSLQKTWYITLGNHDHHRDNAKNEVAYSKVNSRWYLPTNYYSITKKVGRKSVLFIMMDTTPLSRRRDRRQLDWIKSQLQNSKADWIIMAGHHPVFSTGSHGSSSTMYRDVLPLMEKYKVALYLAGHDHNYEHLRVSRTLSGKSPITDLVVQGGGGKSRRTTRGTRGKEQMTKHGVKSYKFDAAYGFCGVELTETRLYVKFIDEKGRTAYSFKKSNPRK